MCGALPGHLSWKCPKHKPISKLAIVFEVEDKSHIESAEHVSMMAAAEGGAVDWTVDSGTSGGMIPDRADLNNYEAFSPPGQPVRIADKTFMYAAGRGDTTLALVHPTEPPLEGFQMRNVLHVPTLADPLLSMGNLCENGYGYVCAPDSVTGEPVHRVFRANEPSVTWRLNVKGGVPIIKAIVSNPPQNFESAAFAQSGSQSDATVSDSHRGSW